jgi:hypothetical protein
VNPKIRVNFLNYLFVAVFVLLCCGLQTTLWYQIFGNLPTPLLWLNLVLYLILYRSFMDGILTCYAVGVLILPFTAMPLGVLWSSLFVIFLAMRAVKKRIFWPGSRYFFLASLGIGIAYHLAYYITSHIVEANPAPFHFFHRFFEIVFTALTSVPIYGIMHWIDDNTGKEILPESGGTL